jgi:hypothetical protein
MILRDLFYGWLASSPKGTFGKSSRKGHYTSEDLLFDQHFHFLIIFKPHLRGQMRLRDI